jgi:hypothetical protein
MSALACQVDPSHFQRIRDIEKGVRSIDHRWTTQDKLALKDIHDHVSNGDFKCKWTNRDEVRDLQEAIRGLTTAVKLNTKTMNGNS